MRGCGSAALLWMALAGVPAVAAASEMEPYALQNTSGWFLAGETVASLALGFLVPDLLVGAQPENLTCDDAWCGTNGFDEGLNRAFLAPNPRLAGHVSHVFTIGITPAVGLAGLIVPAAIAGKPLYALQDGIVMLNCWMIATGLNSIAKVRGKRQRPAYHFGRQADTEAANHEGEEFLSFYSGDTTWAFVLAGSTSTLMFLRGYEWAPYFAIATGVFALTGSLLRMAADMHWATDVLVGATSGAAIGIGVPLLLHRRARTDGVALVPAWHGGAPGVALKAAW